MRISVRLSKAAELLARGFAGVRRYANLKP
jgi:hypothetical protein